MHLGRLTANGQTDGKKFAAKSLALVEGTFGSGTITIQFRPLGHTDWVTVSGVSITAAGYASIDLGTSSELEFRASLTGATSPSIDIHLI